MRWLGVFGSLGIAALALLMLFRERTWVHRKYRQELLMMVLQPEFLTKLRKDLEKDVQQHIADAMKPLAKEVKEALQQVHEKNQKTLAEALAASQKTLLESTQNQLQGLQTQIKHSEQELRGTISTLEQDMAAVQSEYHEVIESYRAKVHGRVKQVIEDRAVELLADYLQQSLQGLELGNQQEFIIGKLNADKERLLQELADE